MCDLFAELVTELVNVAVLDSKRGAAQEGGVVFADVSGKVNMPLLPASFGGVPFSFRELRMRNLALRRGGFQVDPARVCRGGHQGAAGERHLLGQGGDRLAEWSARAEGLTFDAENVLYNVAGWAGRAR